MTRNFFFFTFIFLIIKCTDYYIALDGDDNNSGTISSPFSTIDNALTNLKAGDTLYFREGIYNQALLLEYQIYGHSISGEEGAWIEFTSYPGELATLDGTGLSLGYNALVEFSDVSYIWFHGINVQNTPNAGVEVRCYYDSRCGSDSTTYGDGNRPEHIKIDHVNTTTTGASGICISGYDILVEYCVIDDANTEVTQEGLSIVDIDTFIVQYNKVFNTPQETLDVKDNSQNGIVRYNEISNKWTGEGDTPGPSIYVDGWDTFVKNVSIYGNILHGFNNGWMIGTEEGGFIDGVYFFNNVVRSYASGAAAIYFGTWDTSYSEDGDENKKRNFHVYNNYFEMLYYDATWSGRCIDLSLDQKYFENFYFYNNIVTTASVMFDAEADWSADSWDFHDNLCIKNPNNFNEFCWNNCDEDDYDGLYYLLTTAPDELVGWENNIDITNIRLRNEGSITLDY